eukprot:scaffold139219_cov48-Prasinocladus_malaysianus.AAC.1
MPSEWLQGPRGAGQQQCNSGWQSHQSKQRVAKGKPVEETGSWLCASRMQPLPSWLTPDGM